MSWKEWSESSEHYCNKVTDPSTCCPLAHGETDKRFCTCKVSPEMAKAVRFFHHELYLESWRKVINHKFQLVNHRVASSYEMEPNWLRIDCRKTSGSYTRKDNSVVCEMCKETLDCL